MTPLEQFEELLDRDGVLFTDIEMNCKFKYRINANPLPVLRNWLKHNRLDIPIHYIESNLVAKHEDDIMLKVCGRAMPLLILEAVKDYGDVEEVNLYFISDTILDRKHFN